MLAALLVTAPTDYQVIDTGVAAGETPGRASGTTTHRFTAAAVRDVSVAVGRYDVLDREVGGVRLHLATPQAGTKADPQDWADEIGAAITSLTALFGPFPYPELWVAITPGQSDGTEFPTALRRCQAQPAAGLGRARGSPISGSTPWSAIIRPRTPGSTSRWPPSPKASPAAMTIHSG